MRISKGWIIGTGVVILGTMQLMMPAHSNPPVPTAATSQAKLPVHPAMGAILARSCNDCHSNLTQWPWYSYVAPVSWLVAYDVQRGRASLNFSEWGTYSRQKQQEILKEICTEVTDGEMPGGAYTLLHPSAKLMNSDIASICTWTQAFNQNQSQARTRE